MNGLPWPDTFQENDFQIELPKEWPEVESNQPEVTNQKWPQETGNHENKNVTV